MKLIKVRKNPLIILSLFVLLVGAFCLVSPASALLSAIDSSNSAGTLQKNFSTAEDVYAKIAFLNPIPTSVTIYVTSSFPMDGQVLTDVSSDGPNTWTSGNSMNVLVWPATTTVGTYWIVVDFNNDGHFTYTGSSDNTQGLAGSPYTFSISNPGAAGSLDHFRFNYIPTMPEYPQTYRLAITAVDAQDNVVTSYTGSAALTLSNGGKINSQTTYNTPSFAAGVLNFWAGFEPNTGTGATITATGSGVTGTSNAFNIGTFSATITPSTVAPGSTSPRTFVININPASPTETGMQIGQVQIVIPTGFTVTSPTVSVPAGKSWTVSVASGVITAKQASSSYTNVVYSGQPLSISFSTTIPTTNSPVIWTTRAYYAYNNIANPLLLVGGQPQVTLQSVQQSSTTTTLLSESAIILGGSVTDTATVTTGATGNVIFQVSTNGVDFTQYGGAIALSGSNPNTATSDPYTPTTTGTYYFRAIYQGDSNYAGSQTADNAEMLLVNPGAVVPEYPLGALIAISSCLLAFVAFKKRDSILGFKRQ